MEIDVIIPVGPGHQSIVNDAIQSVQIACYTDKGPFDEVHIRAMDDSRGHAGRSKTRNEAIKSSTTEWLFFLDADDLMHPDAFSVLNDYLDYDAVWGNICEYRDGCLFPRYQAPRIEDIKILHEVDPYLTLQMGFFVKREKMILFREDLNTGEDWDVYLKLWESCRCIKQEEVLMINRRGFHSTGPKSANGRDWRKTVEKIIKDHVDSHPVITH